MSVRSRAWMRGSLCAAIALVAPAGSAWQVPRVEQLAAVPSGVEQIRQAMAGTVVTIDPITGEMRAPTQAEHDALTGGAAAVQRFATPQIVHVPGGGELLMASPATMDFLTAVLGADGSVTMKCTHGFDASSTTFRADHAKGREGHHDR